MTPLRGGAVAVCAAAGVVVLSACSAPQQLSVVDLADELAAEVSIDDVYAHLEKFQALADANGAPEPLAHLDSTPVSTMSPGCYVRTGSTSRHPSSTAWR